MRRKALVTSLLFVLVCGAIYWAYPRGNPLAKIEDAAELELACRVPVLNHRGPDVRDGFRGEVHPLLHRHAQTEVMAYWNPPKTDFLDPNIPAAVRRLYTEVAEAVRTKSYSERDFSGFLPPENVTSAGQLWALDPERVALFLKQFHPAVSTHSVSVGRRPGPDGAFAILRGVSSSHLDIVFRIHAEFDLLPKSSNLPVVKAWYSPACFLGRLVVNCQEGTVEYFQLAVPTEKVTNVHITLWYWFPDNDKLHNMHRVDRMELIGGNLEGLAGVSWKDQIEMAQAHDRLAKVFYKFKDIDFLPFDRALATARAQKKPIFVAVLLGALDDQSC